MRIENWTRSDIVVRREDGTEIARYAPSGHVARVRTTEIAASDATRAESRMVGAPVTSISEGPLELIDTATGQRRPLPPTEPTTRRIVSRVAADRAPHRGDLVMPHGEVRDEDGRLIGCTALAQAPATPSRARHHAYVYPYDGEDGTAWAIAVTRVEPGMDVWDGMRDGDTVWGPEPLADRDDQQAREREGEPWIPWMEMMAGSRLASSGGYAMCGSWCHGYPWERPERSWTASAEGAMHVRVIPMPGTLAPES